MKKEELKNQILSKPLPRNIAFILDGNGRWAKKRGMPRIFGHAKGIETLVEISESCQDLGIESILVYAFSTENWNRPKDEVSFLMKALIDSLAKYKKRIIKKKMRVRIIGERSNLSPSVISAINDIESASESFTSFTLYICFNYGSRLEITNSVKEIARKVVNNELSIDDITEDDITNNLYTKDIGPIDLLVRTSGELRLSNFLLWQLAYSEFIFDKTYWPDFHTKELYLAINEYQSRNRRFGGLEDKNHE